MSFPGKMAAEVIGGGLLRKPATLLYPYEKAEMPRGFRGRLVFHAERCVFCKLCMKDCPAEAITINKLGEKQYEAIVNLGRCIYCGQCTHSCNKDALEMSKEYELASTDFSALTVNIGVEPIKGPEPAEGACGEDEVPSAPGATAKAGE